MLWRKINVGDRKDDFEFSDFFVSLYEICYISRIKFSVEEIFLSSGYSSEKTSVAAYDNDNIVHT